MTKQLLTEKQMYIINLIRTTAKQIYQQQIDKILAQYLTPQEQIQQWKDTPKEERWERLHFHLSELEPRSLEQIGEQYITEGNSHFKIRVINRVICYAEENGQLDAADRQNEIEYRQEVYAYKKVVGRYGIHGLTTSQIKSNALKGSKAGSSIGGKTSHVLKRGVHKLSVDELVANGSRGGLLAKREKLGIFDDNYNTTAAAIAGAIARGQTIYSEEERAAILRLAGNTEYHLAGQYKIPRPDWQKIAEALTEQCGVVRTKMSVRKYYEKLMRMK